MEEQNEKLERYHNNMKKASRNFRKLRKSISNISKLVIRIFRFLIPFIISPLTILLLLIIIFFWGLYMLVTSPGDTIQIKKVPSIVLSKDKIEALGFEIYEEWDYKGKIKWCENLSIPSNIYTSFIEWYADEVFKTDARVYDNLCLYHLLYIKKVERYYEFEEENETIEKIDERLSKSDDLKEEQVKYLKDEKKKLKSKIGLANEALELIKLAPLWEGKFRDYEDEEIWFSSYKYIDYPISYFKNRKNDFLDMLYYNHIWSIYWESYPEWISLWWGLFWFWDDKIYYNMLNELWTEYDKNNIATEFLNWNHWLPDFIDDLNSRWEYYNYNCPVCESEDWCSCTWDPEEDYWKHFGNDNLWGKYYKDYINFITDLTQRKVIYVSENVKSPFRDYIAWGKACNVDIKLTQRDWPSNLSFWFFKWYPKVNWVKTHAWIDLATEDNCNWDEVPVYSITEWIVIFKSYSMSSWGNSIIIKTNINDQDYYVRYSHLRDLPKHWVWDYVTTDSIIGTQGDTWPSTAEHLDVTIYNWTLQYEDYLKDTLNWWWLFNFSFTDMMQNWFWDYSIWSFNPDTCYNCWK